MMETITFVNVSPDFLAKIAKKMADLAPWVTLVRMKASVHTWEQNTVALANPDSKEPIARWTNVHAHWRPRKNRACARIKEDASIKAKNSIAIADLVSKAENAR